MLKSRSETTFPLIWGVGGKQEICYYQFVSFSSIQFVSCNVAISSLFVYVKSICCHSKYVS